MCNVRVCPYSLRKRALSFAAERDIHYRNALINIIIICIIIKIMCIRKCALSYISALCACIQNDRLIKTLHYVLDHILCSIASFCLDD